MTSSVVTLMSQLVSVWGLCSRWHIQKMWISGKLNIFCLDCDTMVTPLMKRGNVDSLEKMLVCLCGTDKFWKDISSQ